MIVLPSTYRNFKRPFATAFCPRLCPRAQGRGAARLALGRDRRLRIGEGSASAGPWGDGCGKGDWAGWRGLQIQNI